MSSQTIIKNAIAVVAEHVRSGEIIEDWQAFAQAHPDGLEGYMMDAINAQMRGDSRAVNRAIRDAQMEQPVPAQMVLPGITDPAWPLAIRVKGDDGEMRTVPADVAKKTDIWGEVAAMRRQINTREKTVSQYEATLRAIEEHLPVDDDMTGADIRAMARALSAGDE
jgi:hypothetical protein